MKIAINKRDLGMAVKSLSRVINKRNPIPVLSNLLCDVKDNAITITASDGEATMVKVLPLELMEGDGRFMVSAAELSAALDALPAQPLTIIADIENGDASRFRLEHESGHFYFPLELNIDEYPLPMEAIYPEEMTVNGGQIVESLKRCAWAATKDDLRPVLNGACFKLNEGWLDVVATDGHSLVRTSIDVSAGVSVMRCGSFLMPSRVIGIVLGMLGTSDVEVRWNVSSVELIQGTTKLTFVQTEGTYPRYESVIPTSPTRTITTDRNFLAEAIKKVTPFTCESSKMIRMSVDGNAIELTGEDADFGRGSLARVGVAYVGDPIKINFSSVSAVRVLQHMPAIGELDIQMTENSRPIVFVPHEQMEDENVLMLIMPMLGDE